MRAGNVEASATFGCAAEACCFREAMPEACNLQGLFPEGFALDKGFGVGSWTGRLGVWDAKSSAAAVAENGVANVHKSGLLAHYSQRLVLLAAYIGSEG